LAVYAQEGASDAVLVPEADLAGNDVDRLRSLLNARQRCLRAQPFDDPGRRVSGLLQKKPGKFPCAEQRTLFWPGCFWKFFILFGLPDPRSLDFGGAPILPAAARMEPEPGSRVMSG
jgi:hypothetical protein